MAGGSKNYDDIDPKAVLVVLTITVIAIVVVVTFAQAAYYHFADIEYQRKVVDRPNTELNQMLDEQRIRINKVRWIDRDQQTVALPIEDAKQLIVQQYPSDRRIDVPNEDVASP